MKKTIFFGIPMLALFATAIVFFYSSCTTDPCKDVVCLNDGVCNTGTCDCAPGYEGTDCSTVSRDKFIGNFLVNDQCSSSGTSSYNVTIAASSTDVTKALISNVWGTFANTVVATIDGSTMTIALQEPDNDGFTVSGSGTINGATGVITITYTVTDTSTGNTDSCNSIWTKQ